MPARLRLRATDEDDLAVLAACLQDALLPIGDMSYQPEERRFVFVANRFCWEAGETAADQGPAEGAPDDATYENAAAVYERTNCGVWFDEVDAVRTRGIDLRDRGRILELLTIRVQDGALLLIFAGGATVRLEISALRCFLEDIGESWPTRWRPGHDPDQREQQQS